MNIEYRTRNIECRRVVRRRRVLKYGAKRRLPIIPIFQHSIIPIAERSGAKFFSYIDTRKGKTTGKKTTSGNKLPGTFFPGTFFVND